MILEIKKKIKERYPTVSNKKKQSKKYQIKAKHNNFTASLSSMTQIQGQSHFNLTNKKLYRFNHLSHTQKGLPEYSSIFSRNCGDMASESAEAFPGLLFCVLPNLLLQTIGFFSPYWIKNETTTECYRGVVYNVNCPNNVEGRNTITFYDIQNIDSW